MDKEKELTPTMEELVANWKLTMDYAQLSQLMQQYAGGMLPIKVICPNCSSGYTLNVPIVELRAPEPEPVDLAPQLDTAVQMIGNASQHMCSMCGQPYTKVTGPVEPIWNALNICSMQCWAEYVKMTTEEGLI